MIQAQLEQEVAGILRRVAFSGSDREINSEDPLGEFGLGLDSLALTTFITALENRFEIEIPESIWVERGQMSFKDLVELIAKSIGERELSAGAKIARPVAAEAPALSGSPWDKLIETVRGRGVFRGMTWGARKSFARLAEAIYKRDHYYILAFDLVRQPVPQIRVPDGTTFRAVSPDDLQATNGLWRRAEEQEKQQLFVERLRKGYTGYAAWLDGNIVGLCWVTEVGDFEPDTGLQIKLRENSCYGLDLNERPDYHGRGIGLATVAFSLQKAAESGRAFHYSIVHEKNERMLAAAIQLVGYRMLGEIVTTRWLLRPHSVCYIQDKTFADGVLTL
ncbi:MAG: acyl carrier protein [Candidatus Zixiibacteriota bacterium]